MSYNAKECSPSQLRTIYLQIWKVQRLRSFDPGLELWTLHLNVSEWRAHKYLHLYFWGKYIKQPVSRKKEFYDFFDTNLFHCSKRNYNIILKYQFIMQLYLLPTYKFIYSLVFDICITFWQRNNAKMEIKFFRWINKTH